MYKKILTAGIVACMVLSISACGKVDNKEKENPIWGSTASIRTEAVSDSATENIAVEEASVEEEKLIEIEDETTTESSEFETNKNDSDKKEYQFEGEQGNPIEIVADEDIEITLNNVSMNSFGDCIKVEGDGSVTIILNGENTLVASDTENEAKGIVTDGDLTLTGDGILNITATDTCIKSKNNLFVNSGTYILNGGTDGDGLRSNETLTIDGGTFNIDSGEGIESTAITINEGDISIKASDDGINASEKSENGLSPVFTMNGGNIYIEMAAGDTDAIDSNGDISIHGGNIEITAQSGFDWDGNAIFDGGEITVNGEKITNLQNQFGGGGGFFAGPPANGESHPNDFKAPPTFN